MIEPNVCSIIPARGGSKSIPRKNIKLFNGHPLINYSIDYTLSSKSINRTVVSTDDIEIAKISKNLGADVPFIRPQSLGKDLVQDYPVILHALNELEELYKEKIDIIVLLRPTSPLRPSGLIDAGIELLIQHPKATSVRAVSLTKEHPYRQWTLKENYISSFAHSFSDELEPFNLPRQKLPDVFFQTGDIEIVRRETLLGGSISGDHILPLIIDASQVFDIDSQEDFEKAEKNLEKLKE